MPPPPPTAAERGIEVRQRLLRAAVELIGEVGTQSVSTRLLAERAGVRPGLVHYHFASLPALLRQAAMGAMRPLLTEGTAAFTAADSPAEGAELLLRQLDGYTGRDPQSLLAVEVYLSSARDPELRAALSGLVAEFREAIAAALDSAGHPDPAGAAATLAALLDGFVLHKGLSPELTADDVIPTVRHLMQP
ncbi:TetR/AcrR family transcriptional regulator [Streptomyces sp. B-S-A8]|uniref:TetR/AcrR family transcriptional regulator n=1 Tax=Streptomyces solicavernae TaxID=3043614 RepID=A0ABT6RP59_9ACTN|nr:TetR/AcrR family transcriptional regulator [Streptomyces sp. B-S-A8]MDI3386217.1 TetR/AcrR family transcriptional regulator [Streptomyces sp. B-S-A8]